MSFACGLITVAPRSVIAQPRESKLPDRVLLRTKSGGRLILKGTILDYTGKTLTLSVPTTAEALSYPAKDVIEVHTPHCDPHERALEHYGRKNYEQAESDFEAALDIESDVDGRRWVRRELLAMLVKCALRTGKRSTARSRFSLLTGSDKTTRHFSLIPLQWTPPGDGSATVQEGRTLMASPRPEQKLMGASLLLQHRQYGKLANAQMRGLIVSPDRRVGHLATAQLWRLMLTDEILSRQDLARWQTQIDRMPADLRGGPYYLLGRGFLRRAENDRAAMAMAWPLLVYDADSDLAARAGVESAEALLAIGQRAAALTLYRDVASRFPSNSFAQDAKSGITSLTTEGTDR